MKPGQVARRLTADERETEMERCYAEAVAELGPLDWTAYCRGWWDTHLEIEGGESSLLEAIRRCERDPAFAAGVAARLFDLDAPSVL